MRLLLAAPVLVLASACAGTPTLPTPEREPPRLCLSDPLYHWYKLPTWFDEATLEDQAALIDNAAAVAKAAIAERDVMLDDCEAWFQRP